MVAMAEMADGIEKTVNQGGQHIKMQFYVQKTSKIVQMGVLA